jgi:hypothetical protein
MRDGDPDSSGVSGVRGWRRPQPEWLRRAYRARPTDYDPYTTEGIHIAGNNTIFGQNQRDQWDSSFGTEMSLPPGMSIAAAIAAGIITLNPATGAMVYQGLESVDKMLQNAGGESYTGQPTGPGGAGGAYGTATAPFVNPLTGLIDPNIANGNFGSSGQDPKLVQERDAYQAQMYDMLRKSDEARAAGDTGLADAYAAWGKPCRATSTR